MKKIKLKKIKKKNASNIICYIIIFIIIFTILFLNYINKILFPTLMEYAKQDAKKFALTIMEHSVDDRVLSILKEEEIFTISKNKDGEISDIDFNPIIINKVLNTTTKIVSDNLKNIEKGNIDNITYINKEDYNLKKLKSGIISELPLGLATKNALLSNIGPKIPVRLSLSGNVVSNILTNTKSYGINSAIVEIYAHVEVYEQVMIPFISKEVKIQNNVPIAIKIINGKVPEYYLGEKNLSSFSIPIDNN